MKGEWIRKTANGVTVVFVHGILSSAETCWKHENGTCWFNLLEQNSELQEIGIYAFSYNTGVFSGSYNLNDVVDALKEHLKLDEVLKQNQRLIFVCHSMGGIVVRKFIVERQAELMELDIKIGLFLVASPSLGSDYANLINGFAKILGNSQADALRFNQNNIWLNGLDKEFINLKEAHRLKIIGKELIEDKAIVLKKFLHKQIVEPFSGARYFGEHFKVPNSDHSSIAKPENEDAIQHRLLIAFIQEIASQKIQSSLENNSASLKKILTDHDDLELFSKIESLLKNNSNIITKLASSDVNYLTIELNNSGNEYLARAWLNGVNKHSNDNQKVIFEGQEDNTITLNQLVKELIDEFGSGKPIIEFFVPQNLMYYHFDQLIYDDEPICANFKVILRSLERVKRKEENQTKRAMNLCFENWIEHWNRVENKVHGNFNDLEWLKENESDNIRNMLVNQKKICFAFDFQLLKTHTHLKNIIKCGAIAAIWSCSCENIELLKDKLKPFLDEANIASLPDKIYEFRCGAKKTCVTLFLDTPDRLHPEQLTPKSLQIPSLS